MQPVKSDKTRSRLWLIPAALTMVAFIANFVLNLAANYYQDKLRPYIVWVLITGIITLIITIISAIREQQTYREKKRQTIEQSGDRNNTVEGNAYKVINITGDRNTVHAHYDKEIYFHRPSLPLASQSRDSIPSPRKLYGRDDLLCELQKIVEDTVKNSYVKGICLWGLGGVGKTQLAYSLAERFKPYYSTKIYINLGGNQEQPLSPLAAMAKIIKNINPSIPVSQNDQKDDLFAKYISVLNDTPTIILLDDAADREQVKLLIPPQNCLLLITSRREITLLGMPFCKLEGLSDAAAAELLESIVPRVKVCAEEIAKLCGRLPMSLESAAYGLSDNPSISPTDYAQLLADERKRFEDERYPVGQLSSVYASLGLSYKQLGKTQQKLWRMLAIFPDTFDRAAVASLWGFELKTADNHLSPLINRCMVEWVNEVGRGRLHDLMRSLATSNLSQNEREKAAKRHAEFYESVAREIKEDYETSKKMKNALRRYETEWKNIDAAQSWAISHKENDKKAARLCIDYVMHCFPLLDIYLSRKQVYLMLCSALDAARLKKLEKREARVLRYLGDFYRKDDACCEEGRCSEAIEPYEKALRIYQNIGDSKGEANVLNKLGVTYRHLHSIDKSLSYLEKALSIRQKLEIRDGEAYTLGNIGLAYFEKGHEHESKVIEYFEQSLSIREEIGDKIGEGNDLGYLGLIYYKLGKYQNAIEYCDRAISKYNEDTEFTSLDKVSLR